MEEKETIQPIEITWEELQSRDLDRYILVDTRGDEAVNYGMIPGAIAIPECELIDRLAAAAGDKTVILYCCQSYQRIRYDSGKRQDRCMHFRR